MLEVVTMRMICLILVAAGKNSIAMDATKELFRTDDEHSCYKNEI